MPAIEPNARFNYPPIEYENEPVRFIIGGLKGILCTPRSSIAQQGWAQPFVIGGEFDNSPLGTPYQSLFEVTDPFVDKQELMWRSSLLTQIGTVGDPTLPIFERFPQYKNKGLPKQIEDFDKVYDAMAGNLSWYSSLSSVPRPLTWYGPPTKTVGEMGRSGIQMGQIFAETNVMSLKVWEFGYTDLDITPSMPYDVYYRGRSVYRHTTSSGSMLSYAILESFEGTGIDGDIINPSLWLLIIETTTTNEVFVPAGSRKIKMLADTFYAIEIKSTGVYFEPVEGATEVNLGTFDYGDDHDDLAYSDNYGVWAIHPDGKKGINLRRKSSRMAYKVSFEIVFSLVESQGGDIRNVPTGVNTSRGEELGTGRVWGLSDSYSELSGEWEGNRKEAKTEPWGNCHEVSYYPYNKCDTQCTHTLYIAWTYHSTLNSNGGVSSNSTMEDIVLAVDYDNEGNELSLVLDNVYDSWSSYIGVATVDIYPVNSNVQIERRDAANHTTAGNSNINYIAKRVVDGGSDEIIFNITHTGQDVNGLIVFIYVDLKLGVFGWVEVREDGITGEVVRTESWKFPWGVHSFSPITFQGDSNPVDQSSSTTARQPNDSQVAELGVPCIGYDQITGTTVIGVQENTPKDHEITNKSDSYNNEEPSPAYLKVVFDYRTIGGPIAQRLELPKATPESTQEYYYMVQIEAQGEIGEIYTYPTFIQEYMQLEGTNQKIYPLRII